MLCIVGVHFKYRGVIYIRVHWLWTTCSSR